MNTKQTKCIMLCTECLGKKIGTVIINPELEDYFSGGCYECRRFRDDLVRVIVPQPSKELATEEQDGR